MASHGVPRLSANSSRDVVKEKKKIDEYKELVELVNAKIAEKIYTVEVLALTTKLLLRNPEYYTIWNHRRLILLQQFSEQKSEIEAFENEKSTVAPKQERILEFLDSDLDLLVGFLLQYPKCYWIWKYRLWLLEQAEQRLPLQASVSLWQKELGLVNKMLMRDERNFHGWGYRRTVVSNLERMDEQPSPHLSMVEDEFAYTTRMISSGLKNFSAWHNRSKLIPRLLEERNAESAERRNMLDSELDLIQNALTDPFNQSAWDYHAFLMGTMTPGSSVAGAIANDLSNGERTQYFEREMDRAKEMLEIDDDCKLIYEALVKYAVVYRALNAGGAYLSDTDMTEWFAKLRKLDPLRNGRWRDLENNLKS